MIVINITIMKEQELFNLTNENKKIFNYIKNILTKEYPTYYRITLEYYILGVLLNEECYAYKILDRLVLSEVIEKLIDLYKDKIKKQDIFNGIVDKVIFEERYDEIINQIALDCNLIDSARLFLEISLEVDKDIFKKLGCTIEQYKDMMSEIVNEGENDKQFTKTKNVSNTLVPVTNKIKTIKLTETGDAEKYLDNISNKSDEGRITEYIGGEEIYKQIFTTFAKCNKNNVIIVGESGVGKTCLVRHLANLINRGEVPPFMKNKTLLEMNFNNLVSGTGFKGMFEAKYKSIVDDAKKRNKYIFFIDDIHSILSEHSKFGEVSIDVMLDEILSDNRIMFIATTNYKSYKNYINNNSILKRRFQKIILEESDEKKTKDILNYYADKYSHYHNVIYSNDIIDDIYRYTKRYITDLKMPDAAIDMMDEIGSYVEINASSDELLESYKITLDNIVHEINTLFKQSNSSVNDKIDKLRKEEINIKSCIKKREKELNLLNNLYKITENEVKQVFSSKTGIPLQDLSTSDKDNLKKLDSNLKKYVFGQDEAINEVCQVIKRQRFGISNPNKPAVLFFAGSTGTGKTYLAKMLAKHIFGDEKYMVRLDMSEYGEKMSTNKLYGSAAGYVGYENGGILTESIKKKKHCVLLLDEIEKANEDVHNVFLQLFDEGRLTDNTGEVIDFKNVIIIMTSNVGVKESIERGNQIGFNNENKNSFQTTIIKKELKRKFKPEFLNRIDKIIFFNKLSEDNIKNIIINEIKKVEKRVNHLGYYFDKTITECELPQRIMNEVKNQLEYGARPILRTIQSMLEDKLTEYLLNNEVDKGFIFNISHI